MQSAILRDAVPMPEWHGGLTGIVYGHPKLPDGARVYTSIVRKRSRLGNVVTTRNTIYTVFWKRPAKPSK